jgi:hypothetical protein
MPVNNGADELPINGLDDGVDNNQDTKPGDLSAGDAQQELLVSGLIYPLEGEAAAVEIRRGMTILTTEGEIAGIVAGVINDRDPQQVKYILLSRPSQQIEYLIVPIELVQQISEETVLLHVLAEVVNTLPPWHR